MPDDTPILRADALDDDLQLDDEPELATGGYIPGYDLRKDEVLAILDRGYVIPRPSLPDELIRQLNSPAPDRELACPVCGLAECRHNLPYVPREGV